MRHGQPDINMKNAINAINAINARDFNKWIKAYNNSGINLSKTPGEKLSKVVTDCNTIVCSDHRRSIQSAEYLALNKNIQINPLFREAGLPFANWKGPKFSPRIWSITFRLLWFLGYKSHSESYSQAVERSVNACKMLQQLAAWSAPVLLIGHGFMNRFIARQLRFSGWSGPKNPGRNYWSYAIYEKRI